MTYLTSREPKTALPTRTIVLLAAMARVKKIPSRAAVGLVYVPRLNAFGGHMWTEVFVRGSWIPLDGTLGRGYVGCDRLKFADTSFSGAGATPLTEFSSLALILGDLSIELLSRE